MSDYQPAPPPSQPYQPTPPPYQGGYGAPEQKSPILSILALVFGIIGVVGSLILGIGFLPAVAGVVLGFIARVKEPATKKLWLPGLICGFAGIVVSILWFVVPFIIAAALPSGYSG